MLFRQLTAFLLKRFGSCWFRPLVSIAALPLPHLPGLYQKAFPKITHFALNRRGRKCRHSGTF
jgi:hypothetical protein